MQEHPVYLEHMYGAFAQVQHAPERSPHASRCTACGRQVRRSEPQSRQSPPVHQQLLQVPLNAPLRL
jgi:hypothetical protein